MAAHTRLQTLRNELNHWKGGVRLYIGISTVTVTLLVQWWASSNYKGTSLYATRMEEVFAWLALSLVTTAVFIGPFFKFFPNAYGKKQWFEARRLLGVSGGWFATLHVIIVYSLLFRFANPFSLPSSYQYSFIFGGIALLILLSMVATSFDKAFKKMGIWWFRLHRFVYIALLSILAHSFIVGVHATEPAILRLLSVVAGLLVFLHVMNQRKRPTVWQLLSLSIVGLYLVLVFNYGYHHMRNTNIPGRNYAIR